MVREETVGYGGSVVLYRAQDGKVELDVRLEQETIWLNLNQIADLFERDKSVISRHLRNVFASAELARGSVVAFFATTAADGKTYQVEHFNLDAIISVGYRVNSKRGTQFRIWATQVLRDHVVKGYSVNEHRLKELRQSIHLVGQVLGRYDVSSDEAKALLRVVMDYERALDVNVDSRRKQARSEGHSDATHRKPASRERIAWQKRMSRMPPKQVEKYMADEDAKKQTLLKGLRDAVGDRVSLNTSPWDRPEGWDALWHEMRDLALMYMKGHAFADIARAFLGLGDGNISHKRTAGDHPIPGLFFSWARSFFRCRLMPGVSSPSKNVG